MTGDAREAAHGGDLRDQIAEIVDAIANVDCTHPRHRTMCAPCAAKAVRGHLELRAATLQANLDAAATALRRAEQAERQRDHHREVAERALEAWKSTKERAEQAETENARLRKDVTAARDRLASARQFRESEQAYQRLMERLIRAEAAIERVLDYLDALIANGFGATDGSLRALRTVLGGPAAEDLGRPLSSRHEDLLRELLALAEDAALSPAGGSEKEEDPKSEPVCKCGHAESSHDAGECWDETDGDRCRCAWYESADPAALCPGEPPRTITTHHLPGDVDDHG